MYAPDILPVTEPTVSMHWRELRSLTPTWETHRLNLFLLDQLTVARRHTAPFVPSAIVLTPVFLITSNVPGVCYLYGCVCHCAQLSYTTQHRTVLTIFPLILQINDDYDVHRW